MGWLRDQLSAGILSPLIGHNKGPNFRNEFDGARQRRRLANWNPTSGTVNTILTMQGEMLRKRCRDVLRNNAYATAGAGVFRGNLIGTGIKPSSLIKDNPELRARVMEAWTDWTDEADADEVLDFYGMQTTVGQAMFEAGECFVRFRPRRPEDGVEVPIQVQLLESEMVPYQMNQIAPNGNWIMNGIELDFRGKRVAYWMYQVHPGDAPIEPGLTDPVRVPASEVIHVFVPTRPGQMRGVPLMSPALLRLFFLDQYDDAELERKRIAAMFAGFITSPAPEDIIPIDEEQDTSAPQEGVALSGLEPGTLQTLLPGEEIAFSEPADVGGAYEAYMFRQLTAAFIAMGVPYTIGTTDLRRANYSSLRGAIVEFRRRLEQLQHNIIVFQMCRPIWKRWMDTAVLAGVIKIPAGDYLENVKAYQRARWIPPRQEWVDPLKDRQAEKLAVDAGFKPRSDVVESEGFDPEENDQRIRADRDREEELDLVFAVQGSTSQPQTPAEKEQARQDQQDALDQAQQDAEDAADNNQAA